ncbi:PRC-barrel domain-containing protein [uncultured Methanobrevibacter sp.]|uniref:PRC-barrel domain-containing protein n=1 Tax=uncultured Methanobrevibacter sp. TaxID=253161 RepID=UPI0025F31933|nr:PRC-barrel domain-containing protein [uncultured Methanobrevibacter sp.]
MVEVSNLRNLSIYTNTGHYVGQVEDIVLNIRLGTISKLQVRAVEPERKQIGLLDNIKGAFQGVPEENVGARSFKNDLLTVDFDKVQAIGDIMLINPRDIKKVTPEPPMPETVSPRQNPQQPPQQPPKPETQPQFENKPNFE